MNVQYCKSLLDRIVVVLIAAFSILACGNKNKIVVDEYYDDGSPKNKQLKFKIELPDNYSSGNSAPVSYGTISPCNTIIHDRSEYNIESLFMYEFDLDTKKLVATPENIKSKLSQGSNSSQYNYIKNNNTPLFTGKRRFIFIANEGVPAGITVGSSIDDLISKLSSGSLSDNGSCSSILNTISGTSNCIPMFAYAVNKANNSIDIIYDALHPVQISVKLQRILARVDINNNVPELKIESFSISNVKKKSYIVEQPNSKACESDFVMNIQTFTTIPGGSTIDFKNSLKKAFYLYESDTPKNSSEYMRLDIKAKYKAKPQSITIKIPLVKNNEGIKIKRNTIYIVNLGNGQPLGGNSASTPYEIEQEIVSKSQIQ